MVVKLRLVFSITILFCSFYGFSQAKYWERSSSERNSLQKINQQVNYTEAKIFSLDEEMLKKELKIASTQKSNLKIIYFPNEKGEQVAFRVFEKPVFSSELAKKYPEIKSYCGYRLDKKGDKIVFSISPNGIQSMMIHTNNEQTTFMQKTSKYSNEYVVYNRGSKTAKDEDFICSTKSSIEKNKQNLTLKLADDQLLRKYRLAVSASGEYTTFHGGTVAEAMAAINATVTRINEVFETDLGVSLELIANTDLVIYTDATTDPYTGNLNTQIQNTLTSVIGEENYDIGHLFHEDTDNGNAGFIGSVCIDNRKGSGYSSSRNPQGDKYDLDFVAHELGHQFGANHTWSFESEGTLVQVEPGSGTTIMGYAGIAQNNNVAPQGDAYFHYHSINQISDYLATTSCSVNSPLVNSPPTITPIGNFSIPKSTAFILTGNATDIDIADVLTYTWEQVDNGIVTHSTFGPTNPSGANFRSQKPSVNPERYFPKLERVVQGNLTETNPNINSAWETVSTIEREMSFALTVRDNSIEGGQVSSDIVNVSVIGNSGPFTVTSQTTNEIYTAGSTQNITWDVANTNKAPINLNTVDIFMSTDGGLSFPILLAENIPNDGLHAVLIPGIATTACRVMVKAHDNIFYALNSTDFTIEESEIVLNFPTLEYTACMPNDIIASFNYETYLGFNEETTFSTSNTPTGLNVAFSSNTAQTNNTPINITFSNTNAIAEGIYPITVIANSATVTKEVIINLSINNATFSEVVLTSPTDGMLGAGISQILTWEENIAYSSYDIEVSTDIGFTNVIDASTVKFNTYIPENLVSETTYYWRLKPKNICGEGTFGTPFSFTTAIINCKQKTGSNLPIPISASGTPTITSKIQFLEDLPITDINVNLNITHTYLSDLIISLTSPAGTIVVLTSNSCGEFRNIDATFDTQANGFICSNSSPSIQGTVKPLGSLAAFNGESLLGEWTLTIEDTAPNDGGMLNDFSLDVCAEGIFRPDDDEDGIFDDGDDMCLGTPKGIEVDSNGCAIYRLPSDNFTLSLKSESCRDSNDGAIIITPVQVLDYSIIISGETVNRTDTFTNNYSLENLNEGTYSVCIIGTDGTITYEELCFNAIIKAPEPINIVSSLVENNRVFIELSGASLYNIELNGIITQTEESTIELNLKEGVNTLKVTGDIECQGVYEKQLFVSDNPIIYPNPVETTATVFLGKLEDVVIVKIYTINGQLVKEKKYTLSNTELELDFNGFSKGIYLVNFEGIDIKGTYKVIKK